jgi:3-methyladenine DNA glycosylase Mpg
MYILTSRTYYYYLLIGCEITTCSAQSDIEKAVLIKAWREKHGVSEAEYKASTTHQALCDAANFKGNGIYYVIFYH